MKSKIYEDNVSKQESIKVMI